MWALLQSLGPPQMLSLVETRDDTHPKQYWSTPHPSCDPWFICMCIQSQWATDFHYNKKKTALMGDKIIVDINQLIAITCKLAQH